MWTRCSRVIWLCLTKQHSQTHEFLLGPFSHHWSETERRQAERPNEREWDQGRWERKHFFGMKQNTITRETCFSYVHIPLQDTGKEKKKGNLWMEKRKLRSPGAKSSEMSSASRLVVSQGPKVPWPDWLSAWNWGAWLAVAHSTV